MSECGAVAAFALDCDFPQVGGTENDVLVFAWEDIKTELGLAAPGITFDATTLNLIDAWAFATSSGGAGYLIEGNKNMVKPKSVPVQTETGVKFQHTVIFQIADNLPTTDKIVSDIKDKRIVVMVKNIHTNEDGQGKYKVYGMDYGLVMSAEGGVDQFVNQGAYLLTFASDEFSPEKYTVYSFYNTDLATTDAEYVTLQTPA